LPVTKFITYPELPDHGVPAFTRKHLIDMQRRGQFPRARQLSPNRIAWLADEITEWVASRPVAKTFAKKLVEPEPEPRMTRRA
jgi:predicted DNA-binding transcriptional regulator AlpA